MEDKILLDTSVVRSTSVKNLAALFEKGQKTFVSSYSFWEILCHLNESQKFKYFKSHLCKFKYLSILDDPFGIIAKYTKTYQSAINDRICDDELILGIISVLEYSDSIQHFYYNSYTDSKDKAHKIQGCAERGREILNNASDRYMDLVTKIIKTIKDNKLNYKTSLERHELILQLIDGWVCWLDTQGENSKDVRQDFTNEVYVYFSYILHRALIYLEQNNQNIDPNDYEDSQICLHLYPNSDFIFIANDKSLYNSVDQTVNLLHELDHESSNVTLQVKKSDYFEKLLA